MRTLNYLALVALLSGGCVVVHDNNPPPPGPGPGPSGPPVYRIQPGAGTAIAVGTQPGYGITANLGGSYRAEWTGQGPQVYNNFTGTIYTPGHFTVFNPGCNGDCPDEANDVFTAPEPVAGGGEQITFNTFATTGYDGLDFGVDLEPVDFDLQIDGVRYPDLVFFTNTDTQAVTNPGEIPFDLTTN